MPRRCLLINPAPLTSRFTVGLHPEELRLHPEEAVPPRGEPANILGESLTPGCPPSLRLVADPALLYTNRYPAGLTYYFSALPSQRHIGVRAPERPLHRPSRLLLRAKGPQAAHIPPGAATKRLICTEQAQAKGERQHARWGAGRKDPTPRRAGVVGNVPLSAWIRHGAQEQAWRRRKDVTTRSGGLLPRHAAGLAIPCH